MNGRAAIAIFDLDGTLADTLQDLANAVNFGLRTMGCPEIETEKYKKLVGNGAMKLCERALPEGRKSEAPALHKLFSEYYGAHYLDNTRLYDGIEEVLAELSRGGIQLAVATNKPEPFARAMIEKLLPGTSFSAVLGGCAERPKKPDPAIISQILGGLPASGNVFMIGDSNVDIETGKNSGIKTIGCAWGFRGAEELEAAGADFIAYSPKDILGIIKA